MSREVCGICWCPYDENTKECACAPEPTPQRKPLSDADALRIATEAIGRLQSVGPVEGLVGLVRAVERAHGIKS